MLINEQIKLQSINMCNYFRLSRLERNLSIKDLSKLAKVPVRLIKEYENNEVSSLFKAEYFFNLCHFFGVSEKDVFLVKKEGHIG